MGGLLIDGDGKGKLIGEVSECMVNRGLGNFPS
jgi:hypothetical protein